MDQKRLSKWMKIIVIGAALCGLVVYAFVVPGLADEERTMYPEFENRYLPWLLFLLGTGLPCFAALIPAWMIAADMRKDKAFTAANAKRLKLICLLAAGDGAYFFAGNLLLLLLNMSHPGVFLACLMIVFAAGAIAIAAAVLSHLVGKAATLQEQADLTV